MRGDITGNLAFSPSTFENTIGEFTSPSTTQITATATATLTNSTSEFAPCVSRVALPELVISKSSVEVTEGSTATYTVNLPSAPSADVTVKFAVANSSVATVSPTETTFTSTDFSETVTVTPVADDDGDNEATELRHLVSIGSNEFLAAVVPVDVTDDDVPGLTLTSTHTGTTFPTDVSVGHFYDGRIGSTDNPFNEGATTTYTVQLDSQPDGDTTISLSSSDTDALTVSPTSITFTKEGDASDPNKYEWDDPQTVTLTAESDTGAGDEIESVYHEITVDGKDYVLGLVRALIRDTGLPALTYTPGTREVTIGSEGGTATYTIVPATEPASNLAMRIFSSDVDSVTVSPVNHTFTVGTNANWATPLTMTVTGVADGDTFDDIAFIRHRTTFGGDDVSWASVQVTVSDGNRAPFFEDGLETTREVPETAIQGASVGGPITATDLDGDTLTYTLDDPSNLFEIGTNGQITVLADNSLDHEDVQDYSMEVAVTDRTTDGLTDKIEVKVLVTNVNEPPVIARTTGDDALSYPEDTATTRVLHRYTATDPERGTITWSVEGTNGGNFAIDASGNLRFASQPDHETTPSNSITVVATDNGNPVLKAELPVTVTITNVDEPPEITQTSPIAPYPENASFPAGMYSAVDPERATTTFTWTLGGTDNGDFTISSNGQLQFANAPDFESPADSGRNNEYNVQVRASDGSKTGTLDVAVTVQDVNEAPMVSGDAAISYPENTATTRVLGRYSATDPERSPVTWSLSSRSGNDADAFRIDSSGNLYFDGEPDHEAPTDSGGNNVYDIQIVATDDGNLGDGTSSGQTGLAGSFDVTVTVAPVDEPPVVTGTTTINDYAENAATSVATYTAADPEGDTSITWSVGGTDRSDFDVTGGVLTLKNAPDYERPADSGSNNHYEVTIYATDSNNKRGELHVDVIVQNVDEPPEITESGTLYDFPENSPTSRQVGRYTASDPEGATVTLSLSSGGANFTLASNGVLTFAQSPDYEEQSRYIVTVRAVAGSHTVNKTVTVNIQNAEEPGAVSLSTVQPQEGTPLTVTLDDDDGPTGTSWEWYRTSSRGSTGTAITSATSDTYAPDADDVGSYLRAVASYDDGHGDDKTAAAVSANRVQEAPPDPEAPVFPADGDYDRSIRENTRVGTNLGAPVRATDANSDRLTYSIPASVYFEIVDSTGQLRTKVELDHEASPTLNIRVTATDPGGLTDTVSVTITVEDVDETPEVTGPTTVEVAENGGTNVATYTATDPDDTGIDWVLTGSDSDALNLSGGLLSFDEVPDYEEKNQYRVTIEARERSPGTGVSRLNVTVQVTNVDERGMVEVAVSEPRVGQRLTPTVSDPDGGVGSIEWKWERRESGGDWTPIPTATSQSYTLTRDDDGYDLRVTAIYRDREGPGKTETFEFTSPVVLRPFFPTDSAARTQQENTPIGRNVGARFTASHPDNVNLTYSLTGGDTSYFTVESSTGQLRTSATPLDYETLAGHEAEVEITATDPNGQTAIITVTITITDECQSAGEPPCAPGRPGVSSASDTSLRVTWSTPRTSSGTSITAYDLQYRESDSGGSWISQSVLGTDGAHTIENLIKDTTYEVQVRASNGSGGYGEWSQSGNGTPGYVPPPPPPVTTTPVTPTPTPSSGGGGGGGGSFSFGGGGGGGGAPVGPPRPPALVGPQAVTRVFAPLLDNGTLVRIWRFNNEDKSWTFYDPRPIFAQFNSLRLVRPPVILIVRVTRAQEFRGEQLSAGWNFINVR